jgi:hypothetical protein
MGEQKRGGSLGEQERMIEAAQAKAITEAREKAVVKMRAAHASPERERRRTWGVGLGAVARATEAAQERAITDVQERAVAEIEAARFAQSRAVAMANDALKKALAKSAQERAAAQEMAMATQEMAAADVKAADIEVAKIQAKAAAVEAANEALKTAHEQCSAKKALERAAVETLLRKMACSPERTIRRVSGPWLNAHNLFNTLSRRARPHR